MEKAHPKPQVVCPSALQATTDTEAFAESWPPRSGLGDGGAAGQLVGELGVVVRPGAAGLAPEAPLVLLLHDAAVVVAGDTVGHLAARVDRVLHHALLVGGDVRVVAPGAGILLNGERVRRDENQSQEKRNEPRHVLGRERVGAGYMLRSGAVVLPMLVDR